MTATERAKRSDALFNDRTKRELADMVVHREADLEDARAENAKLQNDADLLRSMLQVKRKDAHALMSENAELRELARHMRTCMEHYEMDGTINCDRCPLDNNTGNCDFERRMSEMGVVK